VAPACDISHKHLAGMGDIPPLGTSTCVSALGHKRTFGKVRLMSALPPKADIDERGGMSACAPVADIASLSR
jgi:hypothetical protein